jgi:hypothetical protein
MEIEEIIKDIAKLELNDARYDAMVTLLAKYDIAKEKIEASADIFVDITDGKTPLCNYTGLSTTTASDLVISKALEKLADDMETNNGKFSKYALSKVAREDVLDFISLNSRLPEVVMFAGIFKDVLEVNKTKYRLDYYKKPEFERVKENLRKIKGITF